MLCELDLFESQSKVVIDGIILTILINQLKYVNISIYHLKLLLGHVLLHCHSPHCA